MANPQSGSTTQPQGEQQASTLPSIQVPHPEHQSPRSTSSNPSPIPLRSPGGSRKHPLYRGIRSRSGKWVSEIREPRKTTRIWLGTYPTPDMAAAAYDVGALTLKGPNTPLNFHDYRSSYPIPKSTLSTDIRAAAASAAAARRVKIESESNQDRTRSHQVESTSWSGQDFIDEEAILNMPNLLVHMAGGMLVSPPRINTPKSDDSPENSDVEGLWSY
ncbi:ethylene-responsive transcription factor ERF027-like [Euphorbia lathyris]|uniref:ethylene-responsive transcription factor ERF027-like n=1 Tax=Euphorbia lathyris TaxID=212925 RepID=UPI0033140E31